MVNLKIKSNFGYFDCVCNCHQANDLLDMLSEIPNDAIHAVKSIKVEADKNIIGKEYEVYDNSYCINIASGKNAELTKRVRIESELGAKFIVANRPYVQRVKTFFDKSVYRLFVNVESTTTGSVYRVLFSENAVRG